MHGHVDISVSCTKCSKRRMISVAVSLGRTRNRVAYDRQLVNFEALECVRTRRQRREVDGAHTEPPDGASGALAAEVATERYLSKTPAAKQTREAVRGI